MIHENREMLMDEGASIWDRLGADLNGDGKFSIADVVPWLLDVLVIPGDAGADDAAMDDDLAIRDQLLQREPRHHGRERCDGSEQHYSALDQINPGTVDKLSLAWFYDLESGFSVSAPVVAQESETVQPVG